jgi:hypothetical protein
MTYLTRDDFIRIACEAGIDKYLNTNGHLIGNLLERFGQKVVHEIAARGRSEALTNLNKAAEDMGQEL